MHMNLLQLYPIICDPVDHSPPVPLSMGFCRQEYWSGLPCPPPEDLPDPGIEITSFTSPDLAGSSLPVAPPGRPSKKASICKPGRGL